jgi:hypothetical protein
VVIHPERSTSPTAAISSSDIDGREKGRKSFRNPMLLCFYFIARRAFRIRIGALPPWVGGPPFIR